ncbi:MAG: hypothetical protein ABIO24_08840, partial [Saprospiraceae bacterium]
VKWGYSLLLLVLMLPAREAYAQSRRPMTTTPILQNDHALDGVDIYDLVLIAKHTLGVQALDSPYKMIAADANNSKSITTFDIVELRKLILGFYQELPDNTVWRYVEKAYVFPDLLSPFSTLFPEKKFGSSPEDVVSIKVGDVNNSVEIAFDRPAGNFPLREARREALQAGAYYTLPVRAAGEVPLIAWQASFRFDPALLELVGPSMGDVPGLSAGNFNLAQAGEGLIRALWFAQPDAWEEESLLPGQALFNLTFRVKQEIPAEVPLLRVAEGLVANQGWTAAGAAYTLQDAPLSQREAVAPPDLPESPVWLRCHPNPGAGPLTFDIQALPQPRRARLLVYDAFGNRMWWRDLDPSGAPQQLSVPEAANWSPGVYYWELRFDRQRSSGSFVRQ